MSYIGNDPALRTIAINPPVEVLEWPLKPNTIWF